MKSVIIIIDGVPTRVSEDWTWDDCDGQGGRKTVADFPRVIEPTSFYACMGHPEDRHYPVQTPDGMKYHCEGCYREYRHSLLGFPL